MQAANAGAAEPAWCSQWPGEAAAEAGKVTARARLIVFAAWSANRSGQARVLSLSGPVELGLRLSSRPSMFHFARRSPARWCTTNHRRHGKETSSFALTGASHQGADPRTR